MFRKGFTRRYTGSEESGLSSRSAGHKWGRVRASCPENTTEKSENTIKRQDRKPSRRGKPLLRCVRRQNGGFLARARGADSEGRLLSKLDECLQRFQRTKKKILRSPLDHEKSSAACANGKHSHGHNSFPAGHPVHRDRKKGAFASQLRLNNRAG